MIQEESAVESERGWWFSLWYICLDLLWKSQPHRPGWERLLNVCYISMCSGCSWPICIAPHKYKAPLSFSRKQETLWLQQANQLILCLCECKWDNRAELTSSVMSAKLETDCQEGQKETKLLCAARECVCVCLTPCITPISPQHTQK